MDLANKLLDECNKNIFCNKCKYRDYWDILFLEEIIYPGRYSIEELKRRMERLDNIIKEFKEDI